MKKQMNETRKYSIMGGITLIIMTLLSIYAFGIVLSSIYVNNAPTDTMNNIKSNYLFFISGNISWVFIAIMDLIVAIAFYQFLKTINPSLALISGGLRVLYTLIFSIGIVNLFILRLDNFMFFWSLGLFVIGFHLIVTGICTLKSSKVPLVISILLIIAGLGYSTIHGIYRFLPDYETLGNTIEQIMMVPMTLGELSFGIWLLIKGGKESNKEKFKAEPTTIKAV